MKAILVRFVGIVLALTAGLNLIGCSVYGPKERGPVDASSSRSAVVRESERDWIRPTDAEKLARIEEILDGQESLGKSDDYGGALNRLEELVEKGYAPAQYKFGALKLVWQDLGLPDSGVGDRAFVLFQKAAAQNHPEASYQLARFYLADNKLPESIQQLEKSADSGYAPAMALLAFAYRTGALGSPDLTTALAWAEKGATARDAESMVLAGQILQKIRPADKAARNWWFAEAAAKEHLEGLGEHAFAAWPAEDGSGSVLEAAARLRGAVDHGKKVSMSSDPLRPDLYPPADSLFKIAMLVQMISKDQRAGALFTAADSIDLLKKAAKADHSRSAALLEQRGISR